VVVVEMKMRADDAIDVCRMVRVWCGGYDRVKGVEVRNDAVWCTVEGRVWWVSQLASITRVLERLVRYITILLLLLNGSCCC